MKDIHLYYRSAYSDYLEKICGCVYNTKSSFRNLNFFKKKVCETTSSWPRVFAPTVYLCLYSLLFSSVLTNKYQRTATVKHKENTDQCAIALKDMSYEPHIIVNYY